MHAGGKWVYQSRPTHVLSAGVNTAEDIQKYCPVAFRSVEFFFQNQRKKKARRQEKEKSGKTKNENKYDLDDDFINDEDDDEETHEEEDEEDDDDDEDEDDEDDDEDDVDDEDDDEEDEDDDEEDDDEEDDDEEDDDDDEGDEDESKVGAAEWRNFIYLLCNEHPSDKARAALDTSEDNDEAFVSGRGAEFAFEMDASSPESLTARTWKSWILIHYLGQSSQIGADVNVVRWLLDQGASPWIFRLNGKTALSLASADYKKIPANATALVGAINEAILLIPDPEIADEILTRAIEIAQDEEEESKGIDIETDSSEEDDKP